MTHRLYIDEVGNSDLNGAAADPNVRFLALTGIITIREQHDRIICRRMQQLKGLIPGHSTERPVILHRREMLRREGTFACLRDPAVGPAFDAELLNLLSASPYLAVTVQMDKRAHLESYGVWHFDPYHYCLRCLVERYVLYLRNHNANGDVVIEARFKKADKKLKASYERIYLEGTENIPPRIIQSCLLSKDIMFETKKSDVPGIQIADLLAHPSARHMRFLRNGEEEPRDFGGSVAQILVERKYTRNPQTGAINGYGRKWLP